MNVNRVINQAYYENTNGGKVNNKNNGSGFYDSLSENINSRNEEQKNVAVPKSAVPAKPYSYRNVPTADDFESEIVNMSSITGCEVRQLTYQDSDYVKAYAAEGFTLIARVNADNRSVYMERKREDGTVSAYEVNIDKISSGTDNILEQTALEAWGKAELEKNVANPENDTVETELTYEEALLEFYEFIEERIKNGPPKYMTGNSEFSIEEWDKLMESIETMETQMTSGIIGFGQLEDGTIFEAKYADSSTDDKPVVQVRMWAENGTEKVVNIDVNQVDVTAATQLEMLAWLSHMDAQGKSGNDELMGSYRDLLYRAMNSSNGDMSAKNMQDFMHWRQNWHDMTLSTNSLSVSEMQIKALTNWNEEMEAGVPYGYLAKDGVINYNGVIFVCDKEHKAIHLGDTSDMKKCIRIPLSKGGSLIVNRDNLGDLSKAIGMFSPEDVNLILRAIAEDAKVQQMKHQIDEDKSGIGLAEDIEEEAETEEIQAATVNMTQEKEERKNA